MSHRKIENPRRRRMGRNFRKLHRGTTGDHPLPGARIDKQQIFLPIIKEAEILGRGSLRIAHH